MNRNFAPPLRWAATHGRAATRAAPTTIFFYFALASLTAIVLAYQFTLPVVIDVGSGSDTAFVQGFSFRENLSDGANFRWSDHSAEIRFWGMGNQEGILRLKLAAPRPNHLQVLGNDQLLGELDPSAGFSDYTFPITRGEIGAGGDLVVTLVTGMTFTAPPDTRNLGVQVDYARIESRGAPVLPSARGVYLIALTILALVAAHAWSGNLRVGAVVGALAIFAEVVGLVFARVETIWFAAPLFWFGALIFGSAILFAQILQRSSGTSLPVRRIFAAMALAFGVRMIFAMRPGFIVDVQDYVVWSYKTVTYGLGTMYSSLNGLWISDQSPGLNYVIHVMGLIYRAVFSPDFMYPSVAGDPNLRALSTNPALLADPMQRTLLRIPALLADLVTGAVIFGAARKSLSERGAWLVALGYWFNPAVLWNSAYWGQTDAIHSLLVLVAFMLLSVNRIGLSFFILGIAALTKPQAAIFAPLLLLWTWRTPTLTLPRRTGEGVRRVASALVAGALGAGLMLAPIVLAGGGSGLLAYFGDTIGHHPILSANAHNLWWLLTGGQIDVQDTREIIAGLPLTFRTLSLVLFGIVYLAALVKAARAEAKEMFALGAFVAFAFFMLPTEIHENYGYALLPLLAVALTRDKNLIPFYVAISATMVLNYALSDPPLFARFGISDPDVQLALPRVLNSAANVILFAVWTVYTFALARRAAVIPTGTILEPQGVTR